MKKRLMILLTITVAFYGCGNRQQDYTMTIYNMGTHIAMDEWQRKLTGYDSIQLYWFDDSKIMANFSYPNSWRTRKYTVFVNDCDVSDTINGVWFYHPYMDSKAMRRYDSAQVADIKYKFERKQQRIDDLVNNRYCDIYYTINPDKTINIIDTQETIQHLIFALIREGYPIKNK